MKYSIHILTTHKNFDRQKIILETWLNNKNNYIFYTDKKLDVGNQVAVCDNDTYFSNGIKNLSELQRVYSEKIYENVDWFLFCDDDTHVNLSNLEKILPLLDKFKIHGSINDGTWPEDRSLSYPSGGAGYLISSDLIRKFKVPSLDYLNFTFYSDVCVGLWIRDNNINMNNLTEFHGQPPEFYNLSPEEIRKSITFHYIKTLEDHKKLQEIEA